jgi:2-hydroxychromene-2-carboxylate isomerase
MSVSKPVDFWFAIGSTYTYLAVSRIDAVEAASGVHFRWRPFNIRHVLIEQNNTPYPDASDKAAYMWRDIERWAALIGHSPRLPAPYPTPNSPLANQVAILAAKEGWVKEYTKATYRLWFEQGQFCGQDPNLSASIRQAGQDPEKVLKEASSAGIVTALRSATEEAMGLGIFGAPTFAIGRELFWGNERLEDAVAWAQRGSLAPRQVDPTRPL